MTPGSKTAKAPATRHRPDSQFPPCPYRPPQAGMAEATSRVAGGDVLGKRALALQRAIYRAQRAVDRGNRLLAKLAPAQKAPGKPGDPMEAIRDWVAAGRPDD